MELQIDNSRWKPEHPQFKSLEHAGELLGEKLFEQYGQEILNNAVIVGCPRSGVVVANAVKQVLENKKCFPDLSLVVCRKIPHLNNPDLGIGAVTEMGTPFFIQELVMENEVDLRSEEMGALIKKVQEEVQKRIEIYRQGTEQISLKNRVIVIVDDGIAGGVTMMAAIQSIRELASNEMARIIIAVPVTTPRAKDRIIHLEKCDKEDFCIHTIARVPRGRCWDIEDYYHPGGFPEVTHEDVLRIMSTTEKRRAEKYACLSLFSQFFSFCKK